jgi:hypothetical protein
MKIVYTRYSLIIVASVFLGSRYSGSVRFAGSENIGKKNSKGIIRGKSREPEEYKTKEKRRSEYSSEGFVYYVKKIY